MSPDDVITFRRNKLDHLAHILQQTERRSKPVCCDSLQYKSKEEIEKFTTNFWGTMHNPLQLHISRVVLLKLRSRVRAIKAHEIFVMFQ